MDEMELTLLRRRVNDLEECIVELQKRLDAHLDGKLEDDFQECMDKTSAAKAIGVTRMTVYKMIKDGRLKTNGMGKILSSSVEALMKARNPIYTQPPVGRKNTKGD